MEGETAPHDLDLVVQHIEKCTFLHEKEMYYDSCASSRWGWGALTLEQTIQTYMMKLPKHAGMVEWTEFFY